MADQTAARAGASNLGKKGIVLLGVVGVSFSAILVKWSQAPSMVLVFYRVLLAALVMTVPCLVQLKKEYRSWGRRELLCCLVSGFFLSLHFTAYFEAIRYTSIASSVVLVDTEVLWPGAGYVPPLATTLPESLYFLILSLTPLSVKLHPL